MKQIPPTPRWLLWAIAGFIVGHLLGQLSRGTPGAGGKAAAKRATIEAGEIGQ